MEGTLRGTFPLLVAVVKDQGPLRGGHEATDTGLAYAPVSRLA